MSRDNNWRKQQGIDPGIFVALFAGTIGHVSGAQILIETAKHLKHRKDILILVVGEGVIKKEMQQLAQEMKVENIRFLSFQPDDRLKELQATADVGLLTLLPDSGMTSVPSKVLGYMAAGRPVIASASEKSDTAQLISNVPCGLVCPPQKPQALADCIMQMSDHEAIRSEYGRNARDYAEKHFSHDAVVDRYEQLICEQ